MAGRSKKPPGELAVIRESPSIRAISQLLRDDSEPPPLGRTRDDKVARIESILVWAMRDREKAVRPKRTTLWPANARKYASIARDAEKLAQRARPALPAHYGWILGSLEALAFAGREMSERKRKRGPSKKLGRKLNPTTPLLNLLDIELSEIPATRRQALIASLIRETLGKDMGSGENVRLRIFDYSKKPGRSPRTARAKP